MSLLSSALLTGQKMTQKNPQNVQTHPAIITTDLLALEGQSMKCTKYTVLSCSVHFGKRGPLSIYA